MPKSIKEIKNAKGKVVLLRVDYNVPMNGNTIRDTFRINASFQSIEFLMKKNARIVLISHIGDDGKQSLLPVANYLKRKKFPVTFCGAKTLHEIESAINNLKNGQILLLENIRQFEGEKKNDKVFSKALASLGDIYVNDAFPVSHRKHASIVGIPFILPSYAGFSLINEIKNLSIAIKPKHPFIFILAGAKFETKIPLLKKYTKNADAIFVAGAIVNDMFKMKGYEVGKSVVDNTEIPQSLLKKQNILTPIDVIVERNGKSFNVPISEVLKNDVIVDIGSDTVKLMEPILLKSKSVIWNGPLGWYEKGYTKSTKQLLGVLAKSKAKVIIGGGDTAVLADSMKLPNNIFVSTGGGASIDFLSNDTLPGIKVLK